MLVTGKYVSFTPCRLQAVNRSNKPELDRESEREKKHRRSSWDLFRSVGHGVKDEEDLPDVCFQSFSFGVTDVERHDLLPLFPSHTLLRKRQKTERV